MQITRSTADTQKGPAHRFTGDAYIDAVAVPVGTSTFAAASVHFTLGARTAWHTHPHGQTIFVTEGVGRCRREAAPVELIRPGERIFFEPGENHWHGAAPNRFMVHVAMQQLDESGGTVADRAPVSAECPWMGCAERACRRGLSRNSLSSLCGSVTDLALGVDPAVGARSFSV